MTTRSGFNSTNLYRQKLAETLECEPKLWSPPVNMIANNAHKLVHLDECLQQASLLSGIRCIASEWAFKSRTNFYIPPEAYAGYSYLGEVEFQHSQHVHHGALFVQAREPSSLHPHHPFQWTVHDNRGHHDLVSFDAPLHATISVRQNETLAFVPNASHQTHVTRTSNPITVPYMHPDLDMPVPPLQLPWYFGALCFSFSLGGVMALYWTPKWASRQTHWFPYRAFCWTLILLQGPCSFLADYVYMTHYSLWHMIDRFLACMLMLLELLKFVVMRPYTRPVVYTLYLLSVGFAIFCFMKSQESQRELNEDGFVFWHCGWHCYPLASILVCWLENCLMRYYGEYYSFDDRASGEEGRARCRRGEAGGLLLSTVVMDYFYRTEREQPMGKHTIAWKASKMHRR
eukprot:CCRYP_016707-RA/>CCRYP_016707-RA protein AED:0.28 eAED:0.28 QI:106/0.5/0.66/1/0.5/0.33/3/219/400